jgi:hypothetical protein
VEVAQSSRPRPQQLPQRPDGHDNRHRYQYQHAHQTRQGTPSELAFDTVADPN